MAIEANPEGTNGELGMERVAAALLETGEERPVLREIVVEASKALARLDANRLEELARSCEALNRDLPQGNPEIRANLARQANESVAEMAVFGRVLQRLRDLRAGRLEYGEMPAQGWVRTESGHGDN